MLAFLGVAALLASCASHVQTTSGADWLAANPAAIEQSALGDAMRQAAAVEPALRFPARIGLARIGRAPGGAGLTLPSGAELESWSTALTNLGPGYGEFVPISPLIAAIAAEESVSAGSNAQRTLNVIRVAAARQHLDAVLIYEVDATTDARNTPLSIADWTLIGALILPTQNVRVQAIAQAMLLDVRNGYHYGGMHAAAADGTFAPRFNNRDAREGLAERAKDEAVAKLAGEAETFFRELRAKLAATRVSVAE
jgi:hypothetical protein